MAWHRSECQSVHWLIGQEIIQLHLIHSRTLLGLKMKSSLNIQVPTGIKLCSYRVRQSSRSDWREVSNCLLHKFQEDLNMHKEHDWSQRHSFWHWGLVTIPVIILRNMVMKTPRKRRRPKQCSARQLDILFCYFCLCILPFPYASLKPRQTDSHLFEAQR